MIIFKAVELLQVIVIVPAATPATSAVSKIFVVSITDPVNPIISSARKGILISTAFYREVSW